MHDARRRITRDHRVPLVQLEPRETPPQKTLVERVALGQQEMPADFRIGDALVSLELDPRDAVGLARDAGQSFAGVELRDELERPARSRKRSRQTFFATS